MQAYPWDYIPKKCTALLHADIPSAIRDFGLKTAWFHYFTIEAQKRGWKVRWEPKKSLLIHVRLDDCAPIRDDDQTSFIGSKRQGYIGDSSLKALIQMLHKRFPEKDLYLITSSQKKDVARCQRLVTSFPYVKGVYGDEDIDYALWQMMCSDILVLSRSKFSIIAGFLHQGTHCFMYEDFIPFHTI